MTRGLAFSIALLLLACSNNPAPFPLLDGGGPCECGPRADGGASPDGGASDSDGAANPNRVTLWTTLNGVPADASWVAARDGDGAWQRLVGQGGRYDFVADSGRYGLAVTCAETFEVLLFEMTVQELREVRVPCFGTPSVFYELVGLLQNLPAAEMASVTLSRSDTSTTILGSPQYGFTLPGGIYDVVAVKRPSSGTRLTPVSGLVIARDVEICCSRRLDLDFASGLIVPVAMDATLAGVAAGETTGLFATFYSHNGTVVSLGNSALTGWRPVGLPGAALKGEDLQFLAGGVFPPGGGNALRSARRYFREPGSMTLTLPPAFDSVTVALEAATPYPRLRASWTPSAEARAYQAQYLGGTSSEPRYWYVYVGAGALAATGASSHTLPDLSTLPGWLAEWGLSGTVTRTSSITWRWEAVSSNRPEEPDLAPLLFLLDLPARARASGLEVRAAAKEGAVGL
jgi:hypothetical protein